MVCEAQFLMDWMIEAKKRGHSIYEIVRSQDYVENVHMLSSLYDNPKEELFAIAIRQNFRALAKFIVNHPDFEYFPKRKDETSVIHFLSQAGGVKLVKLLLSSLPERERKLILDWPGSNGWTPLIWASDSNRVDMVKFLLSQKGINVDHKDTDGLRAYDWAAYTGNIEPIRLMLETFPASQRRERVVGNTITLARRGGHNGIVRVQSFTFSPYASICLCFCAPHSIWNLCERSLSSQRGSCALYIIIIELIEHVYTAKKPGDIRLFIFQ